MLKQDLQGVEMVSKASIVTDNNDEWMLKYYVKMNANDEGVNFYGLGIEKSTPDGVLIEREETDALTESRETAFAMAQAFAKGTVLPAFLLEMVDECYSQFMDSALPI